MKNRTHAPGKAIAEPDRTGNESTTVSQMLVVLSMISGEQVATQLQQLMAQTPIEQVDIYRLGDHKLHHLRE